MYPTNQTHQKTVFIKVQELLSLDHPSQGLYKRLLRQFRSYLLRAKPDADEKATKALGDWDTCNEQVGIIRPIIFGAWGKKYNPTREDADNTAYKMEPRTGTCDIISAVSVTIDKIDEPDQHSKYYDFIRLGYSVTRGQDVKDPEWSPHLRRKASPTTPGDILGCGIFTTPAEDTAKYFEPPEDVVGLADDKTEILIPVVVGEMKRKMVSFDPTGGNQLRQYLVSGVQFLATLGARSVLQFGYVTEGNNCSVIAAFAEAEPVTVRTVTRAHRLETKLEKVRASV